MSPRGLTRVLAALAITSAVTAPAAVPSACTSSACSVPFATSASAVPVRDGAGAVRAAMNVTVHAAETSLETLVDDPHLAALTHEPLSALASGADGLDDIRTIVAQAREHLLAGGWLLLEHGWDQGEDAARLLAALGAEKEPLTGVQLKSDPALLSDGKLNVSIKQNVAVDWAVLHLQITTAAVSELASASRI